MSGDVFPVYVQLSGAEFFEVATRAEAQGVKIADYFKGLAFNSRFVQQDIVRKPSREEVTQSVHELVMLGYSNLEISKRIGINRETVATHRLRIEQEAGTA